MGLVPSSYVALNLLLVFLINYSQNCYFVVDFPSEITQKVILELDGLGFECFETSIGGHGVTASVQPLQPNVEQREKSH